MLLLHLKCDAVGSSATADHATFLRALGFSSRFVDAREHISEEVARCMAAGR
jgi:hypothetical protein